VPLEGLRYQETELVESVEGRLQSLSLVVPELLRISFRKIDLDVLLTSKSRRQPASAAREADLLSGTKWLTASPKV
jgi:hypothetical protein